jgi:hypothetical protein
MKKLNKKNVLQHRTKLIAWFLAYLGKSSPNFYSVIIY